MVQTPHTKLTTLTGLALIAGATLLLELCLTRVLSVSLWYHFAFMVISTALFGLGFSGVALSLRREAALVSDALITWFALFTPVAFITGYFLFNLVPFEPFSLGNQPVQWLYLPLTYLAVTLPFFLSGLTSAALITRYAHAVHQLYLFDLVGAGTGSVVVVFCLPALGGSGTVLAAAALAALGASLVSWEHSKKKALAATCLFLLLSMLAPFADFLIPVRISHNKIMGGGQPVEQVLADPQFNKHTSWNTISRVDVIEYNDRRGRTHRNILIDAGTAVTRLAHPEAPLDTLGPTADEESFFIRQLASPSVLVVGSGGGREVLLALRNGAKQVVAVEINPAINDLVRSMRDFTGALYEHPKVEVHTDEARSFIRRQQRRFDVIYCPHTISNSALSSGSLSLAENHLLTTQAFEDYLDHLHKNGFLIITRPEAHLPRLFTTARKVFEDRGRTDFSRCVAAWRQKGAGLSFYAGFVLSKQALSTQLQQTLSHVLQTRGLEPLYLPQSVTRTPYDRLATDPNPLSVPIPFATILTPTTDDRPFFNQRVEFSQIGLSDLSNVFSPGQRGRLALEERPVAESALVVLLLETVAVALLLILVPLWIFRRRSLNKQGRFYTLLAFGFLGLAYIIIEVGFIQRFSLFLGRPVVVFATTIASLLVASGLGSLASKRYSQSTAAAWAAGASALGSLALILIVSKLVEFTLAWPLPARVGLTITSLFPIGFLMGMPFPLLVKKLRLHHPERIPWAWGINGFASVVGSIGAVLLGMTWGYSSTILVGVVCYLGAALTSQKIAPS